MKIRAATSDDLGAIKALLAESDLPISDVTVELLRDFLVAEDKNGVLTGNVGLERFGHKALLRSLAVTAAARELDWAAAW